VNVAVRTAVAVVATLVVVLGGLYVVGRLNPAPTPPVGTDVLGPDNGEQVSDYVARSGQSLDGSTGSDGDRWALISLTGPVDVAAAWQLTGARPPVMVSQNIFNVPIERVQTPTVIVPTGNTEASFSASVQVASQAVVARAPTTPRAQQVGEVAALRLRSSCVCLIGIVVRADLEQLRSLADQPGVRAVQALPADARGGLFTVVPLPPTATTVVAPAPDDGPVPAR
jgi:hypothetical protein